ncbi:MAG: DUF5615 family PIN-like protein [Acidobacteriota bacterium]
MRRVLIDQGLPPDTAQILRASSWDAVHVREIGMRDAEDADILIHAASEQRVAVTLDRDFPQILALTAADRPSVVLIRQQKLRAREFAALLFTIWDEYESELNSGCVLTVGAHGIRSRRLPLK